MTPEARAILRDRERLAALYATQSQARLHKALGIGRETLRQALVAHCIPIRRAGATVGTRPDLTREALRLAVLRAYWRCDRCPPDCPGRQTCMDPGGECTLAAILEGDRT